MNNPADVVVDVGSNHLSTNITRYEVQKIIPHPDYDANKFRHDIGLLKLKKNLVFNKNVSTIDIIPYNDNFEGIGFIATGWGRLRVNISNTNLI